MPGTISNNTLLTVVVTVVLSFGVSYLTSAQEQAQLAVKVDYNNVGLTEVNSTLEAHKKEANALMSKNSKDIAVMAESMRQIAQSVKDFSVAADKLHDTVLRLEIQQQSREQ